jgi:hypothetical protein
MAPFRRDCNHIGAGGSQGHQEGGRRVDESADTRPGIRVKGRVDETMHTRTLFSPWQAGTSAEANRFRSNL